MSRVTSPHDAHMPSYWGWLPAELQMMILNYQAEACHARGHINTDFCSHPASRCHVTRLEDHRHAVVEDEHGEVLGVF